VDLKKVNLRSSADGMTEMFEYLRVGQLNDHMLNIVQAENRTLDFHIHAESDEMFYVIEGEMQIELSDRLVDLKTGDLLVIPKGVRHRPVCTNLVKVLLIEKMGTLTRDNTGGTYRE